MSDGRISAGNTVDFGVSPGSDGRDRRPRADSASCQEPLSDEEEVAEGEQREELRPVLGEAAITGLEIPELALEHPEGMLDPRPQSPRLRH